MTKLAPKQVGAVFTAACHLYAVADDLHEGDA
jgi:hypothetical protein